MSDHHQARGQAILLGFSIKVGLAYSFRTSLILFIDFFWDGKNFIQKALTYSRFERPDAIDLLRHAWVCKFCPEVQDLTEFEANKVVFNSKVAAAKGKPFGRLNSKNLDTLLWKVI